MKKTRIRENPVVRRAQIVDEGIKIIGERGYHGFTVQALAQRCKMSNAGLLHYFESKDKILLSLLDEIERRNIDILSGDISESLDALERGTIPGPIVYQILGAVVSNFAKEPEIGRFLTVLQAEALDQEHPAHAWFKATERETLELFELLVTVLGIDPAPKARQLLAQLHGLQLQWFRSDLKFDISEEWGEALQILLPIDGMAADRQLV